MSTPSQYFYANLGSTGTEQISTEPGVLTGIILNSATGYVYDSNSGSTSNPICKLGEIPVPIVFSEGLYVTTTGSAEYSVFYYKV